MKPESRRKPLYVSRALSEQFFCSTLNCDSGINVCPNKPHHRVKLTHSNTNVEKEIALITQPVTHSSLTHFILVNLTCIYPPMTSYSCRSSLEYSFISSMLFNGTTPFFFVMLNGWKHDSWLKPTAFWRKQCLQSFPLLITEITRTFIYVVCFSIKVLTSRRRACLLT